MKELLYIAVLVAIIACCATEGKTNTSTAVAKPTAGNITATNVSSPTLNVTTAPSTNSTVSQGKGIMQYLDNGVLYRMLYVIIGLSSIVAIYFIVRALKTRRRKSKSKKYGVIDGGVDMELQPLDNDEDEEDMTLFDVSKNRRGRHK